MALRYLFIDFDSFYASVEQAYAPHLRGSRRGCTQSRMSTQPVALQLVMKLKPSE